MVKFSGVLASTLLLAGNAFAAQKWAKHKDYQACFSLNGDQNCQDKYYTLAPTVVTGEKVKEACTNINAYPWCPESEQETKMVYANLMMLNYGEQDQIGEEGVKAWIADKLGQWTGITLDPKFDGVSKEISNYVCPNPLQNGAVTYTWDKTALTSTVFNPAVEKEVKRCVVVGSRLSFKWEKQHCKEVTVGKRKTKFESRSVCVSTTKPSGDVMEMADKHIAEVNRVFAKIIKMLKDLMVRAAVVMFIILTGGFFCCCFCCCCCCCKPCKSGDNKEVTVTETVTTTAAPPVAAPMAAPAAPAPMMPPAPAPAPAYGYAPPQPMYQQPPMQQPMGMGGMGGINLNISNNNTNTNS